ncbi:VOC family protein [Halobacillus mangrovi]|uniref:VOC family protein n=1 Tax=Halobacillus mangrovi TaxID=402384 RepID=UPI003D989166
MKWHHAGIETARLTATKRFYQDGFGFEIIDTFTFNNERLVWMQKEKLILEFIETKQSSPSSVHFCWEVIDIHYWVKKLAQINVEPTEGPYQIEEKNWISVFFEGPSGEVIELLERKREQF